MVELGFYGLSVIMILLAFLILGKAREKQRIFKWYSLGIIAWMIYALLITQTSILRTFSPPPRMPLLIILPIFALIFFFTSRRFFKENLSDIPKHFPVYIQSFRILVELLIFGAFLEGVFPQRATFEGLNFDILVGLSAPVIGYLIQKKRIQRKGILAWNFTALGILSLTAFSFISSYYFSNFASEEVKLQLLELPYLLLPSILLPFAIFYHVISIRQNLN